MQKRLIDREIKRVLTSGARKTARDVEIFELKDPPFFRATPWHDVFVDRPWKDTATVRAQKICGGERSTEGNDTVDGFGGILKINQVTIMRQYFKLSASQRSLLLCDSDVSRLS